VARQISDHYGVECEIVPLPAKRALAKRAAEHLDELLDQIKLQDPNLELVFDPPVRVDPYDLPALTARSASAVHVKKPLVASGDSYVQVATMNWIHAQGRATVLTCDLASVVAKEDATVHVNGFNSRRAHVKLSQRARGLLRSGNVDLHDDSHATIFTRTLAQAKDRSTVHAYEQSVVHAYDQATVYAHDHCTVHTYGDGITVHAHAGAHVFRHPDPAHRDRQRVRGLPETWSLKADSSGMVTLYMPVLVSHRERDATDVDQRGRPVLRNTLLKREQALEAQLQRKMQVLFATPRAATWSHRHPDDMIVALRVHVDDVHHQASDDRQVTARRYEVLGTVDWDGGRLAS
jgi:hypothetical protein